MVGHPIRANTAAPTCYVLTLEEVKAVAHRGVSPSTGKVSYWLQPKSYAQPEYEEAWDRLGNPGGSLTLPADRETSTSVGAVLDGPEPPLG